MCLCVIACVWVCVGVQMLHASSRTLGLKGLAAVAFPKGGDSSGERQSVCSSFPKGGENSGEHPKASHSCSKITFSCMLRSTRSAPSRTDKKPSRSIHKALVTPMELRERPELAVGVVASLVGLGDLVAFRMLLSSDLIEGGLLAVEEERAVRAVLVVLARASVLLVLGAKRRRRFIARDAYVSNMLTA